MSQNIIHDFIFSIRRRFIYEDLRRWKKKNTRIYSAAYKVLKSEHRDAAKDMYIRRCIDATDMFVDVYWYIKRSEHTKHFDYIYYRCNWTKVKKIINRVELKELPERINKRLDNE